MLHTARSRRGVAAAAVAALACGLVAAAPAAEALTPALQGALVATDPQVSLETSSYGQTVNTTWAFTNKSNQPVRSLGAAYLDGTMTIVSDTEGEPMRVNCIDGAFPLAVGKSVHCTLWRIVTEDEKKAGRTKVVPVDFRPGYGPGWPDIEYYRIDAPDGPAVDLATGKPVPAPAPAPAPPATGSLAGLLPESVSGSLASIATAAGSLGR